MDYLEDVLPADVNAALEAHVRCAAFVASYQASTRRTKDFV
jgi:hypothetical protein